MPPYNVLPISIPSLLQRCLLYQSHSAGEFIHGLLIKSCLHSSTYLTNNLVNVYAELRLFSNACRTFDEMPLRNIFSWNSTLSLNCKLLPRIRLWKSLLGSNELLIKHSRGYQFLLSYSSKKRILPNLSLLHDYGISDAKIGSLLRNYPTFIVTIPKTMRAMAKRVEEIGIPRESGMFLWALCALCRSKTRFKERLELMTSLGWSEAEFLSAFRNAPIFLTVSANEIRKKFDFLVKEAGLQVSYLAENPVLLMLSLQKRLIPRHRVMQILKEKGLDSGNNSLLARMIEPDKLFLKKYVFHHKENVPELMICTSPLVSRRVEKEED